MSIQSEIERINTGVTAAYTVLEGLGATMPETQNIDNLAATVATLPTGTTAKLLWENASPTSNMVEQDISVNTTGYQRVVADFCFAVQTIDFVFSVELDCKTNYFAYAHYHNTAGAFMCRGIRWLNDSKIHVYQGELNGAQSNDRFILLRIYGIEGVS